MRIISKFKQFENKIKSNGLVSAETNVIVGFSVSTSGKFMVKYSLSANSKFFDSLEELIDFVLEN